MNSDLGSNEATNMTAEKKTRICLACGQVFVPQRADHQLCPTGECGVSERERQIVLKKLNGRCIDCGRKAADGHSSHCRQEILEIWGLPEGPCPWCASAAGQHTARCELRAYAEQDGLCPICGRELDPHLPEGEPDWINRDHVFPRSLLSGKVLLQNKSLVHYRCNLWKADDPAPFGQPAWGVLRGIPYAHTKPAMPGHGKHE